MALPDSATRFLVAGFDSAYNLPGVFRLHRGFPLRIMSGAKNWSLFLHCDRRDVVNSYFREGNMIELTALSGKKFWINPHQIETMEANPDTTLGLVFGKRIIVAESPAVVIERIVAYRRSIASFASGRDATAFGESD